jgi:putative flippase GtrA
MVAAGFLINWCVMFAGVSVLRVNYLLVQALAIAAVVVWNYLLSFVWVFRASNAKLKA